MLRPGNKVSYPYQGLCTIGPVVKKIMNGKTMSFYHLVVLDDGGDLFVPVEKIKAVGIRPLVKESEVPRLLHRLQEPTPAVIHHNQRAQENARLLASGSALALAEVVASLTDLRAARSLSFGEKKALDKAKRLLVCELSEVMRQTQGEAEAQIEQALQARK